MPTAQSASISAIAAKGSPEAGSSGRKLGHTDARPSQPESVPALLRQLGLPAASVTKQADCLRAWLNDNIPTRQFRISMRQNGYGILLDRRFESLY
jgi:hypothetical protein